MLCDDWFKTHRSGSGEQPDARKKWNNWWYYNKWLVLGGVIAAVLVFDFAHSLYVSRHNQPDFQIACVGTPLPQGTADALTEALRAIGPDLNGDGQVLVQVNSYAVYPAEEDAAPDPAMLAAAQTRLIADIQSGDSFLFLLEDPEQFQEQIGILSRVDGTLPIDTPDSRVPLWLPWTDCPVLAGLELGSFTDVLLGEEFSGDNQAVLAPFFVAHRNPNHKDPYNDGCEAFWQQLIAGALN